MKKKEYIDKPQKVHIGKYIVMAIFAVILLTLFTCSLFYQIKSNGGMWITIGNADVTLFIIGIIITIIILLLVLLVTYIEADSKGTDINPANIHKRKSKKQSYENWIGVHNFFEKYDKKNEKYITIADWYEYKEEKSKDEKIKELNKLVSEEAVEETLEVEEQVEVTDSLTEEIVEETIETENEELEVSEEVNEETEEVIEDIEDVIPSPE